MENTNIIECTPTTHHSPSCNTVRSLTAIKVNICRIFFVSPECKCELHHHWLLFNMEKCNRQYEVLIPASPLPTSLKSNDTLRTSKHGVASLISHSLHPGSSSPSLSFQKHPVFWMPTPQPYSLLVSPLLLTYLQLPGSLLTYIWSPTWGLTSHFFLMVQLNPILKILLQVCFSITW